MPKRRSKRNFQKRRKKKRNRMNALVLRGPAQQPDRMMLKLRGAYNIDFSNGGLSLQTRVVRANSLNDPILGSASNLKPNGVEEWGNFYNRYRVHACKLTVNFIMSGTVNNAIMISAIPSTNSGIVGGSIEGVIGNPYAKWAVIGPNVGHSTKTLTNYISIKDFFGKEGVPYDDVNQALFNTNPSREVFFNIVAQNIDTLQNAITGLRAIVVVDYFCELFSRKELSRGNPGLGQITT